MYPPQRETPRWTWRDQTLRLPPHAGAGEAGEVWWPPAVLHHRAAHQDAGRLRLLAGAQQALAPPDLIGHAALHPHGHCHGHHEQRLPGVRFLPTAVEKKIPDTPGQH